MGISQEVNLPGDLNRVTVFQGIQRDVYQAMERNDNTEILNQADRIYTIAQSLTRYPDQLFEPEGENRGAYFFERSNSSLRMDVFGKEGTMLRIQIQGLLIRG